MRICQGERKLIHIKRIAPQDVNAALKRYFDVATPDDFWEVKGLYARDGDLCYCTVDGNCYYCLQCGTCNFVYFSLEQGRMENIRGLWECFYEIACAGNPFIRINGRKGRYPKILKGFGHYLFVETPIRENEEVIWYLGHPENIDKIRRRIGK